MTSTSSAGRWKPPMWGPRGRSSSMASSPEVTLAGDPAVPAPIDGALVAAANVPGGADDPYSRMGIAKRVIREFLADVTDEHELLTGRPAKVGRPFLWRSDLQTVRANLLVSRLRRAARRAEGDEQEPEGPPPHRLLKIQKSRAVLALHELLPQHQHVDAA